ncbi:MAG TPA: S1/P1 nuclease [Arenimonas sp.]|uniref:S1/P1 nuclease n=1 Tax=Arenimonas sp. TaxID=1872635 RepID=UPI002D809B4F|nr:S1/P1 nuclease [Arenimonas sp.]HEU0151763.1 S1/P1 nuclease [Arenimonas sp.]
MNRSLSVLLLLALSGQALAWSKQGHQLVGELAQAALDPAAQAEVSRLLAGEPDPTLAGVSTWADQIRAESRGTGNPLGELSSRWHYVNFPREGCEYAPARDCPGGDCVIGAINAQAAILADRSRSDEDRRNALKFVVHFVGDAHQPMHAGFAHDRGGNNFQVRYRGQALPEGQGTNLHGVWDYWLLQSAGLDNPAYVSKLLQSPVPADPTLGALNPPLQWTLESCRLIASEQAYPRRPGVTLTDAYLDRHRPTAERRVRQAGDRLARLLNAALAPAP